MTEKPADECAVGPVACTLTDREARDQVGRWEGLADAVRHRAVDEHGATLWFDPSVADAVRDVAEREAACCAFLSLRRSVDRSLVRLDIDADSDEGIMVAHLLAGRASAVRR